MTSQSLAWTLLVAATLVAGAAAADTAPKAERFVVEIAGARVEADAVTASDHLGERDPLAGAPSAREPGTIALRGGALMARDAARLLVEAFTKDCARRVDGGVAFADKDYGELSRLTFSWGVVTEVSLPALDATSKDPAALGITIQPQFPKRIVQHGEKLARPASGPAWLRSSFKLSIDGLDGALTSVRQIGEVRVAQTPSASAPVQCKAATVTDLTFAIPATDAGGLAAWKDGAARSGTLEYLAADGAPALRLRLSGLKKKAQVASGALTKVTASIDAVAFEHAGAKAPAPAKK
ncbi:MAG: hypothetical protein KIS78_29515 [Labilithrix sp.]|nr:hypothetical protein [Labilithrix sp.]MCW5836574.1 hypothetical protein [Labilithrix sp.]